MNTLTNDESLNYLYSLVPRGIKLGLDNISTVLTKLGNPQIKIPSIHIAGTNGKGSTAAFCESILRNSGYRVGLYTSPHLFDFSERIQLNRKPLPKNEMVSLTTRVRNVVENLNIPITFFEFGTAMAFLYFAEKKADVIVIETGMGGRLDATTLCKGNVSIITSIAKDHISHLGNTLKEIAFEKASIIKEHGTVFAIKEGKKVHEIIKEISQQKSADAQFLGEHFNVKKGAKRSSIQSINFRNQNVCFKNLELSLLGRFQANNAALALSACLHYGNKTGKEISEKSIRKGLKNTVWHGRMEVISSHPTMLLDIAHNPAAIKEMAKSVEELFEYKKVIVILGIMKDKQTEDILKKLSTFAGHFILVRPNHWRSENPVRLKKIISKYNASCEIIENIQKAIKKAKQTALPDDMVCITGSIFTVGEAKQYLEDEFNYKTNNTPPTFSHPNG